MRLTRVVLLCTFAYSAMLSVSAQTIQINQQNKTIAISTTDEATAVADIAAVTVGFEIFKLDSETAAAEAGRLSHAIMEALHKAGVEDKSIESKSQSVSRNTTFDDKENAMQRAQRQFIELAAIPVDVFLAPGPAAARTVSRMTRIPVVAIGLPDLPSMPGLYDSLKRRAGPCRPADRAVRSGSTARSRAASRP